jgi:hypothetical protein
MIPIRCPREVYYSSYKKLDSKCGSEMLVPSQQTKRHHHRQDRNKNICRRMNAKF